MKKQCISKEWYLKTWDSNRYEIVNLPNDYSIGKGRNPKTPGGAANGFINSGSSFWYSYHFGRC